MFINLPNSIKAILSLNPEILEKIKDNDFHSVRFEIGATNREDAENLTDSEKDEMSRKELGNFNKDDWDWSLSIDEESLTIIRDYDYRAKDGKPFISGIFIKSSKPTIEQIKELAVLNHPTLLPLLGVEDQKIVITELCFAQSREKFSDERKIHAIHEFMDSELAVLRGTNNRLLIDRKDRSIKGNSLNPWVLLVTFKLYEKDECMYSLAFNCGEPVFD